MYSQRSSHLEGLELNVPEVTSPPKIPSYPRALIDTGFLAPTTYTANVYSSTTYTSFMCPSFTYNQMATGTWTLTFSETLGSSFAPVVFVVASPTSLTDYVYATITSTTTLPPAPTSTTTVQQTTGTTTQISTLSPEPTSTTTATAYSTTIIATDYSNPPPLSTQTVTDYTTTVLSTITLSAEPSSTSTATEYSGTSVALELSTSTISNSETSTEYICSSTPSSSPTPTPTPLSCPEDDGKAFTAADGAIYTVECSTDHYGGNLAMSYQSSLETCIELCESTASCVDVSWLPGNPSGPCYLKKNVGENQENSGVWGALRVSGPTSSTSSSASSASSTSPTASPTGVSPECPNGISSSAPSCPSTDGVCFAVNDALYSISCFTDDYGNDIALSWETTFESCLATCSATSGCVDVSYVAASDGSNAPCYMKSAVGTTNSDTRIWGARLVSPANPSTTTSQAITVVKRAAFTKGPNYTYPPIPHTTITTGPTSTATATPAPSGIATSTAYVLATATGASTPAPSGVRTTTLTTASTSTLTITNPASVSTTTLKEASTSYTTATPAQSGVATTTVTLEAHPTSVSVAFETATALTVTVTGCPVASSTASSAAPQVTEP